MLYGLLNKSKWLNEFFGWGSRFLRFIVLYYGYKH